MKTSFIILFALLFSGVNSFSQDTLVFLSGKTLNGNINSINDIGVSITSRGLLFKNTRYFYNDELFLMSKKGQRTMLYAMDSANGNVFSIEQMDYFIKGLQEGKEHYHAPFATLGGLASGVTGGFFGFWGMTIPTTYVFITGIKTPKINMPLQISEELISEKEHSLPEYGLKFNSPQELVQTDVDIYTPYYNYGYQEAAKDKKIKNAIRGGIIGFIAFVATSYIMISK